MQVIAKFSIRAIRSSLWRTALGLTMVGVLWVTALTGPYASNPVALLAALVVGGAFVWNIVGQDRMSLAARSALLRGGAAIYLDRGEVVFFYRRFLAHAPNSIVGLSIEPSKAHPGATVLAVRTAAGPARTLFTGGLDIAADEVIRRLVALGARA